MLSLPEALRSELKDPAGPVYASASALLADAGAPVVAVGDVVTDHLLSRTTPDVALVDGHTKRTRLDADRTVDRSPFDREVHVENPPGTLTEDLLRALCEAVDRAVDRGATTLLVVDGEEDLAAVPAVALLPEGGSVVYGQPDEGMVLVRVDDGSRRRMVDLLDRMDGDVAGALALLGVDDGD